MSWLSWKIGLWTDLCWRCPLTAVVPSVTQKHFSTTTGRLYSFLKKNTSMVSLTINIIIGLIRKLCGLCWANSYCSFLSVTSLGRLKWHICSAANVFWHCCDLDRLICHFRTTQGNAQCFSGCAHVEFSSAYSGRILLSPPAVSAVLSPMSTCCVLLTVCSVCLSLPLYVCMWGVWQGMHNTWGL